MTKVSRGCGTVPGQEHLAEPGMPGGWPFSNGSVGGAEQSLHDEAGEWRMPGCQAQVVEVDAAPTFCSSSQTWMPGRGQKVLPVHWRQTALGSRPSSI